MAKGKGTKDDPWVLKTPRARRSTRCIATMGRPADDRLPGGQHELGYQARCIEDLQAMLRNTATGWSSAPPTRRSRRKKAPSKRGAARPQPDRRLVRHQEGHRGRFGMYVPPLLEALGLAELEHNPRNNRMRAI